MDTKNDWEGNARAASNFERVGQETGVTETMTVEPDEHSGFNVMLRLVGGDRIEAASFAHAGEAHTFAEELIASASRPDRWPRVGDRYLRPETIVSIDVEPDSQPRWTGSTGRASSWTGRSSD
jgi:hypothetical protein